MAYLSLYTYCIYVICRQCTFAYFALLIMILRCIACLSQPSIFPCMQAQHEWGEILKGKRRLLGLEDEQEPHTLASMTPSPSWAWSPCEEVQIANLGASPLMQQQPEGKRMLALHLGACTVEHRGNVTATHSACTCSIVAHAQVLIPTGHK